MSGSPPLAGLRTSWSVFASRTQITLPRERMSFRVCARARLGSLRLMLSEALVVDHFGTRLKRVRLSRLIGVRVAERQNREDRPSVGNIEHPRNPGGVEISDPACAKAERPSGVSHVL